MLQLDKTNNSPQARKQQQRKLHQNKQTNPKTSSAVRIYIPIYKDCHSFPKPATQTIAEGWNRVF